MAADEDFEYVNQFQLDMMIRAGRGADIAELNRACENKAESFFSDLSPAERQGYYYNSLAMGNIEDDE